MVQLQIFHVEKRSLFFKHLSTTNISPLSDFESDNPGSNPGGTFPQKGENKMENLTQDQRDKIQAHANTVLIKFIRAMFPEENLTDRQILDEFEIEARLPGSQDPEEEDEDILEV